MIKRPPLRYRGGKWRDATWIIQQFPKHECYVEPFFGGGSVLFQKDQSDFEVINDLDDDVVTFFRVLRDRPEDLQRALAFTPYARAEFKAALEREVDDEVEQARRLFIRCWQGRGSANEDSGWRFQIQWHGWRMNVARYFRDQGHLGLAAARLSEVQIENGDYLRILERFDSPGTLFYLDPPYLMESRNNSPRLYKNEWKSEQDHIQLAAAVDQLKGMVVLSGYPSSLYDRLYGHWTTTLRTGNAEAQKEKTECLWISPNAAAGHQQQELPL